MRITILLCSFCTLLLTELVHADNFRCPNGSIVSTGDSISVVTSKCDTPTSVIRNQPAVQGTPTNPVYFNVQEEWTYNEGPHRLVHYLIFSGGTLIDVRTGGYGK